MKKNCRLKNSSRYNTIYLLGPLISLFRPAFTNRSNIVTVRLWKKQHVVVGSRLTRR